MGRASNRKWFNRVTGVARAKLENLDPIKLARQLEKFSKLYPNLVQRNDH